MDEDRTNASAPASDEDIGADELDARIDYEEIAARSEVARRAGRLVRQDEVARAVDGWLRALETERRPA